MALAVEESITRITARTAFALNTTSDPTLISFIIDEVTIMICYTLATKLDFVSIVREGVEAALFESVIKTTMSQTTSHHVPTGLETY
jgi:hypothetical protein